VRLDHVHNAKSTAHANANLQQAPRRRYKDVHAWNSFLLLAEVLPADNEAGRHSEVSGAHLGKHLHSDVVAAGVMDTDQRPHGHKYTRTTSRKHAQKRDNEQCFDSAFAERA
jgi:hypothetical protein